MFALKRVVLEGMYVLKNLKFVMNTKCEIEIEGKVYARCTKKYFIVDC